MVEYTPMKFVLSTVLVLIGLQLFAERQPFERYQSILDRQMFGQPPTGFDPTKPPSEVSRSEAKSETELQAQERIKTAIRFSAINVTPEGDTAVGFTDSSDSKNPVHYYLKVGESRNGWLVKEADPVKATMTIVKDEVEVTLSIGGNSAQSGASGKDASTPTRMVGSGRDRLAGRSLLSSRQPGAQSNSLRSRRMLREQQRQADEAEAAAKKEAEAARQEEARRREEEERAQRAAEREEQRTQLLQNQEELRKAREARAAREASALEADENGGGDAE